MTPEARPAAERPTREPVDVLLRDLGTARDGLGAREASRRLDVHGPNELPQARRAGWVREFVRQLTHPLALLLWVAAALAWVAQTPALCWAILAVVAINAVVAYLQERQAERAIEALSRYLPQQARVLRDGVATTVPARELVRGDVIVIGEGDRVSADARVIDGAVELDLSALTGESAPVSRTAGATDTADRLIDAPDAVFSGAECTSGAARAVVFATGPATELGRIAALSRQGRPARSPLERQVRRSTWLIAGVAVAAGALFLPLGLLAGLSFPEAGLFAIGLLVANVPEGLLPTITLALAVGVRVLARQGALVKQLSAVETLGSTTVICTDKTGTLTQNVMQVARLWAGGRERDPGDGAADLVPIAEIMADCTEGERRSDPMETALVAAAGRMGVSPATQAAVFPFDAERRRMSVVARREAGLVVAVKGAPESVLPLCTSTVDGTGPVPLDDTIREAVLAAVDGFARRGLRVLALAGRDVAVVPPDAVAAESGLRLVGLVALLDPPRPEVPDAVAACHAAGITVHVVTGDYGATAAEIAREVGIRADRVIGGAEADALSEPELDRLLAQPGEFVFARSAPEGKLRIAEALQHAGQTVAMTGDGVNDAPALHRADIGIAMGRSGTDVAREAATMILTDDNFATIVAAVREGRRAYDNLRKFVLYIFVHAVPEVVPFLLFALSGGLVPLPLTVLQILAIDLGTEILPALALARERAEPDLMTRRPRPRSEPLITGRLLVRAWAVMGPISAALALGMFFLVLVQGGWSPGAPVGPGDPLHGVYLQATSATFATIVACQAGTAFAARTERASLRAIGVLTNRALLAAIGAELLFVLVLCYIPPLQFVFGTAPLPGWVLLLLLPCPVIVWGADEVFRWAGRARHAV